jgi:hypothetical protein
VHFALGHLVRLLIGRNLGFLLPLQPLIGSLLGKNILG